MRRSCEMFSVTVASTLRDTLRIAKDSLSIAKDWREYTRLAKQFPVVSIKGAQDEEALEGILTEMDLDSGFKLVISEEGRNRWIKGPIEECPLVSYQGELLTPDNFQATVDAFIELEARERTMEYIRSM